MSRLTYSLIGCLGLVAASLAVAPTASAAATSYFVSAKSGNDNNPGTSASKPLASLDALNQKVLKPGDTVNLDATSTWLGPLTIDESGTSSARITVKSYNGTSSAPTITGQNRSDCVVVSGNYVTVTGVKAYECGFAGFDVRGDDVVVSGVESTASVAGVFIEPGADRATLQYSKIFDNRRLSVNTPGGYDDSGAFGVVVSGDNALVQGNTISGNYALSYDFGNDGSAVEIYASVGARILRNRASSNATFVELGSTSQKTTANTVVAYNDVTGATATTDRTDDHDDFLVTRGAGKPFGPVNNTTAAHNSVYLTNPNSDGVVCDACSTTVLTLEANVVRAAEKSAFFDGPYGGGSNFWFGGFFQNTYGVDPATGVGYTAPRDRTTVDPKFTSPSDLRLHAGSPAIDYAPATSYTTDVDGVAVPRDGDGDGKAAPDSGAHER